MSMRSQQNNMKKLSDLLSQDLSGIHGAQECGPNGEKKTFLNVGKVFLRALGKDLGLRNAVVRANAAGIGTSGDCTLCGMWEENGIYVSIGQFAGSGGNVVLYRGVRNLRDYRGSGYNNFIRLHELERMDYEQLLNRLSTVRRDYAYGRAA